MGTLGGDYSRAFGINDGGAVVGEAGDEDRPHAFLWRDDHMTDLHVLPGPAPGLDPGDSSRAESINNSGEVVGEAQVDAYMIHDPRARLWRGGRWTWVVPDGRMLLDLPGSEAYRVNDGGTILCNAVNDPPPALGPESPVYQTKPFLFRGGRVQAAHYLSGFGINNRGDLCGCVRRGGAVHVALRRDGRERDLGTLTALGYLRLTGIALNDADVAAGTLTEAPNGTSDHEDDPPPSRPLRAVWRPRGAWLLLPDLPGRPTSIVHGLNNAGQIVGEAALPGMANGPPPSVAVLWEDSKAVDLNRLIPRASGWTLGWTLESATGINNRGRIVGYGTIQGKTSAFLLTPSAIPASAQIPARTPS